MKRRDFIKCGTVLAGIGGLCFLGKNRNAFINDFTEVRLDKDMRPCYLPFDNFEIRKNGDVYPCPFYLKEKIPAGNIETQPIEEIWNGPVYTDLRQRMLNVDFSLCNRELCCSYYLYYPKFRQIIKKGLKY